MTFILQIEDDVYFTVCDINANDCHEDYFNRY